MITAVSGSHRNLEELLIKQCQKWDRTYHQFSVWAWCTPLFRTFAVQPFLIRRHAHTASPYSLCQSRHDIGRMKGGINCDYVDAQRVQLSSQCYRECFQCKFWRVIHGPSNRPVNETCHWYNIDDTRVAALHSTVWMLVVFALLLQ
jgi:hypothetical protein